MGLNNKKYLDYAGLEKLVDIHAVVPHPQMEITSEGAYKIAFDEHGHITSKSPLTAADLSLDKAMHFVGVSTTDPLSAAGATIAGISSDPAHKNGFHAGDVCLYKRSDEPSYEEYVYTGTAWELLGDASSYAMKDVKHTSADDYILINGTAKGEADHSTNSTIGHKAYTAEAAAIKSIGRDSGGHVVIGKDILVQPGGGHSHDHTTSTTIAKDTYVTGVTDDHTKLSIKPATAKVLKGIEEKFANLNTTSITGVSGSTEASKAKAGTAIEVAKAGSEVTYGEANVGTEVTGLAKRAASKTTVGNANIATSPTTIGNADVGSAVVYGTANVGAQVTVDAGKADVGSAVVYGTANVGTAVEVATIATAKSTFLTGVTASAPTTTIDEGRTGGYDTNHRDVYNAYVEEEEETLVLSPVSFNFTASTTAPALTPATGEVLGVSGTISITPAVAAPSTQKLTPAVASNRTVSFTPAVAAPDTQTLTPAKAATATIYGAVESTTEIYGVTDDQVSIKPAVQSTKKIVPAVANGTITPYTFDTVTVPVAAEAATTVATGSVSVGGAGGAVMTSVEVTDLDVMTAATIVKGTEGDVDVVDEVTVTKNAAATFAGTTSPHTEGTHTHTLYTE